MSYLKHIRHHYKLLKALRIISASETTNSTKEVTTKLACEKCYCSWKSRPISYRESMKLYSHSVSTEVDYNTFDKVCEETLESLTEYFEEICENSEVLNSADVSYSSGVLTVKLGDKYGTYVINRQSPNKQIWLSSPVSGPKRYDLVTNGNYWVYKHDAQTLHRLLQNEISKIVGNDVDFSKCSYAKL